MSKRTTFIDLGLIDYREAWNYQEKIFKKTVDQKIANRNAPESRQRTTKNHLIFCEHPHVYTIGKNGDQKHLLASKQWLKNQKATFFKTNRGGDITYHGPGQVVAYPILDLEHFFTDIHKYLRLLEESVVRTLTEYGITSGTVDGLTGVWLDGHNESNARKICALGVKSSRWITMHGLAFNVNTNLDYFNGIVPCGIQNKAVTSMKKELGSELNTKEVAQKLKRNMAEVFDMELV